MQRVAIAAVALVVAVSACRDEPRAPRRQFDPRQFLFHALQMTRSHAEIGEMTGKAKNGEVRRFIADFGREQREMHRELSTMAKSRSVPIPATPDEKRLALQQNLAILTDGTFDRGYLLAVVQDVQALDTACRGAIASGDRELAAFAQRHLPRLVRRRKAANGLLEKLGGSPFGFVP